jgi:hypothetical protein
MGANDDVLVQQFDVVGENDARGLHTVQGFIRLTTISRRSGNSWPEPSPSCVRCAGCGPSLADTSAIVKKQQRPALRSVPNHALPQSAPQSLQGAP